MRFRFAYRAWRARLRDQRMEIALTRALVRPGDVVVDAGANKGAYTYWLQAAVGPEGRVFAYEPQPALAAYLRTACQAFGWTNVDVRELALSDGVGSTTLYVPGSGPAPGASIEETVPEGTPGARLQVRTDTLDGDLQSQVGIRFLKVDVEGHELAVFRGARKTLERDKPHLLFECEARHLARHSMQDVFSYLTALGYDGVLLRDRDALPVSAFDPARHQRRDGPDFWKRPGYYNNFLFFAQGYDLGRVIAAL